MIAISACVERKHKPEYSPFKNLFSVQRLKLYLSMRSTKPLYWPSLGSFSLTHEGIDFMGFFYFSIRSAFIIAITLSISLIAVQVTYVCIPWAFLMNWLKLRESIYLNTRTEQSESYAMKRHFKFITVGASLDWQRSCVTLEKLNPRVLETWQTFS